MSNVDAWGCAVALLAIVSCGQIAENANPRTCTGFPDDPKFAGSDAWVPSTTDPKCCAPAHNQFICPTDAAADAPRCSVSVGGFFEDDAGVGETFPVGCYVNLTYCNRFYEGTPQSCWCQSDPNVDGGGPSWGCGI